MFVANQGVLVSYASGLPTGTVVVCGESVTDVKSQERSFLRSDVAGRFVTDCMMRRSFTGKVSVANKGEREVARDMREKLCMTIFFFRAVRQSVLDE
jgi:actin-related protein